jgi:CheY-like chemotaxis protein
VELHGGRVEVASGGNHLGARFTVTLPGFKGDLQEINAAPAPMQHSAAPVRVLIVDDNEDAANSLGLYLASVGHVIEVENNGLSGLTRLLAQPFDVFLLDIGLPGMDGHQLARTIRSGPAGAASLVIGISGYGQEADRAKAIESGFDAYFVKPVEPDQVARVIEAWSVKRQPG